ncbi:aspartate aminotransferase [Bifidobacterium dolichotidis]|uniref:Aminotransferase n=1 Tax=Bifidobacterium dolichotidis TaxID=2306976 RepID=A0A430FQM9_9BIFI|nr:pyridoxal phosphate-dependent aminotransferase [Bifidobacterium dolichotidis]RSX55114.1 aspartate aminotransferase [Bifidobacterium dolichotidis]
MINEHYRRMLEGRSVIRAISERATARRAEIGERNVFDFSLGNPSVPTTPGFTEAMLDLYEHEPAVKLHSYSPSIGLPEFREAVAHSLNRRFGMDYTANHIYPTSGATAALAHAFRAVTAPGSEIITFAPFFPEYKPYSEAAGLKLTVLPCNPDDFQIDFDALEQAMNANVQAVLINTPNNPSGVVYSAATLKRLGELLEAKQRYYGHSIFLISDEPYREITFDGIEQPYPSKFYANTLSCYSFSKSLSLPGERIGYVAVNPAADESDIFIPLFTQISRATGHNCPSSSIQRACARVIDQTADLAVYERNMDLLYTALHELGFEVVRPGGTFYIFPKALEDDAVAFCEKAMDYDLFMVPGDSFGMPGYVRLAYCLDTSKVEAAIPVLKRFVTEQYMQ